MIPITCGGGCANNNCGNIIDSSEYAPLIRKRTQPGFVMINPSTLWITGRGFEIFKTFVNRKI